MEQMQLPANVIITHQRKTDLNRVLSKKNYSRVVVLVDSNTHVACYPKLSSELPAHDVVVMAAGESEKNLSTCAHIWQALTDKQVDRKALLLVLGGGVPGDLGGFCAATYKRGIDFILMPTTLLSQVDASVGGKLGIDFNGFKNHIGVFQEPVATIIDTQFLTTLPEAELRSGFAEIIKHCLIGDAAMWDVIRTRKLLDQDWSTLVPHSVAFKASVTQADPREAGLRKILNFGHTIGHAVESYFLETDKRLLHGEAIAIGMIAEGWLAKQKGLLTDAALHTITQFILRVFGHVMLPTDAAPIIHLAHQDKKNVGDQILVAVPKGIGTAVWDVAVTPLDLRDSLQYYKALGSQ
jgi:3-dehydroquinate synthase